MLQNWNYEDLNVEQLHKLCLRPRFETANITRAVQDIIDLVRKEGDEGVQTLTEKFDGKRPDPLLREVRPPDQIPVSPEIRSAFELAHSNIMRFHIALLPQNIEVQTMPGVVCRRESRPIETVGLYIPGGSAPLPSTVLMLGVPARLAECEYIILATPPDSTGNLPIEIEFAASLTGIKQVYLAGGAQAIAAMAYGTESVKKVDKIFGPGNQYVTTAKMMLQNSDAMVAIDMPAGPSEVMVVADSGADIEFIASDLLSQAEHGPDSQSVLVAVGEVNLNAVREALEAQLAEIPRAEIARKALSHSYAVSTNNTNQAIEMVNQYAPEHLILHLQHANDIIPQIRHAGSVFLGPWSPESVGDYASGTNHTLPTYGYARMYSGVSVDSFLKYITFQELNSEGLKAIASSVTTIAETEHLEAHKKAVTLRLNRLRE